MTRVETIGDCTLHLGDCADVLPGLDSVTSVVTDPPYGTNVTGWDRPLDGDSIRAIDAKALNYSVWFYSNTRLAQMLCDLREGGRDTWVAVWHKSNAMGFERRFAPQWVPIVIAYSSKPSPPFWGKDYVHCAIAKQKIDHPTPKQLGVVEWLCERAAKAGETIFDPFMGSGTTGVACAKLGRKFIGVEIDPGYFDIACRRVEEAYRQPMFKTIGAI